MYQVLACSVVGNLAEALLDLTLSSSRVIPSGNGSLNKAPASFCFHTNGLPHTVFSIATILLAKNSSLCNSHSNKKFQLFQKNHKKRQNFPLVIYREEKMDTKKAVKFIWENYFLSLDFNVEPMIKFIKSSRKAEAMLIDTDLINKELLVKELKAKYYA